MDKNNFLFGRTMYKTLNLLKTCIGNKFFGKLLITGLLCFGTSVIATGQSAEVLSRSFWAHQNNRCSSGRVYVIEMYESGRHTGTAYYCENERSEANNVMALNGKNPNLRLQLSVIDNSNTGRSTGSGYNQPSPADIQAERQRQAEIAAERERQAEIERQRQAELEKQREQERLEQQRKFKAGKQELIAGLKGMSQEVTKPLELMGGVQTSGNSLELMGMNQATGANDLALKGMNQPSDVTPLTVSPGQWTMTPDQLERELKMSRAAYELAMQQINNYEKNNNALQQEIAQLTTKNKNGKKLVYDYEKNIAILGYQSTMVTYYTTKATNNEDVTKKTWAGYLAEKKNTLRTQYGLTTNDINRLNQEVNDALAKGVPTLGIIDLDPVDEATERDMDLTKIPKIGGYLDAANNGVSIGEPVAAGMIQLAYSNPENEMIESLSQIKEKIEENKRSIESKKEQSESLTAENERLQKVFQKYGTDIMGSGDDAKIIQFGNECRNALNIKIAIKY